jgi:hypothetical protein
MKLEASFKVGNLIKVNSDVGLAKLFQMGPRKFCNETFYNVLQKVNTNAKIIIMKKLLAIFRMLISSLTRCVV